MDVKNQYAAWARNGPPTYITSAANVGFKPEAKTSSTSDDGVKRIDMNDPSVVEEMIRKLENGG